MDRIKTPSPMLDVVPVIWKNAEMDAQNDCAPSRTFPRLKIVFAWIASSCIDEWKGAPPADIMEHLEEPVMRPISVAEISHRQCDGIDGSEDMLADGSWIVPYALIADLHCAVGTARIVVNVHFRKESARENVFGFCQSYLAARVICEQTGIEFDSNTANDIASAYFVRLVLNDDVARLTETITECLEAWPSAAQMTQRGKLNVVMVGLPAESAGEVPEEPVVGLLELLFGVWHEPCRMEHWRRLLRERYGMTAASFVSAQVDLLSFLTAVMVASRRIGRSQMEDLDRAAQAIVDSRAWTERADLLSQIHDRRIAADTLQAELRAKRAKVDACRDQLCARQIRRLVEGADDTEQASLNAMLALVDEAYTMLNMQQEQVDKVRAELGSLQAIAREKGYMVEKEEEEVPKKEGVGRRQIRWCEAEEAPVQMRLGHDNMADALHQSRAKRMLVRQPQRAGRFGTAARVSHQRDRSAKLKAGVVQA